MDESAPRCGADRLDLALAGRQRDDVRDMPELVAADRDAAIGNARRTDLPSLASSTTEQQSATAPAASTAAASRSDSDARSVEPPFVHAPMPTIARVTFGNIARVRLTFGSARSAAATAAVSTISGTYNG